MHSESEDLVAELQGPPPEQVTPTGICDFTFMLRNLVFREPGLYYIKFWGNDHLLMQRPFEVKKVPDPKGLPS